MLHRGRYFWPGVTERYTCVEGKVVDATISRVLVKFLQGGNESAARSE